MRAGVNELRMVCLGFYASSLYIQHPIKVITTLFAIAINVIPLGQNLFQQACALIQNKHLQVPLDGGKFQDS